MLKIYNKMKIYRGKVYKEKYEKQKKLLECGYGGFYWVVNSMRYLY